MPDLVVAPHDWIDGALAVRALDLGPSAKLYAQGAPGAAGRQGRAYSPDRGTIAAAVPLLRQPMACRVPAALAGAALPTPTEPWSVGAFGAVVAGQAARGALPWLPLAPA